MCSHPPLLRAHQTRWARVAVFSFWRLDPRHPPTPAFFFPFLYFFRNYIVNYKSSEESIILTFFCNDHKSKLRKSVFLRLYTMPWPEASKYNAQSSSLTLGLAGEGKCRGKKTRYHMLSISSSRFIFLKIVHIMISNWLVLYEIILNSILRLLWISR